MVFFCLLPSHSMVFSTMTLDTDELTLRKAIRSSSSDFFLSLSTCSDQDVVVVVVAGGSSKKGAKTRRPAKGREIFGKECRGKCVSAAAEAAKCKSGLEIMGLALRKGICHVHKYECVRYTFCLSFFFFLTTTTSYI